MKNNLRIGLIGLSILPAAILVAAAQPRALAPAAGGLWEVSQSATGHNPTRVCVPSPEVLAQYEHRQARCTRVVISDKGTETVIHYTCADGGFGQSKVTLLTPRSLRIDTQGISGNLPFHYQLHARRVGECAAR
jgi:hypothetical protein